MNFFDTKYSGGDNLLDQDQLSLSITHEDQFEDTQNIYKVNNKQLKKLFDETSLQERKKYLQYLTGVSGLMKAVQSLPQTGISGDERDLRRRLEKFGENKKMVVEEPSYRASLCGALKEKILMYLAICATLSLISGMIYNPQTGWIEGASVYASIFILVLITSLNDWAKDKKFVRLQSMMADEQLPVYRGKAGCTQTLDISNLVVGDIVILKAGNRVPADCVIIDSSTKVETKHFSEESETEKGESDPFLLRDDFIMKGACTALVTCVGQNCKRISNPEKFDTDNTPLQDKLYNLSKTFTFIGIIASLVIFITAIVVIVLQTLISDEVGVEICMKKICESITLTITIMIVAIPEGLPMAVSISLAYGFENMFSRDKILVRKLYSIEKMGQITEMCVGKTASLTTENMCVKKFLMQEVIISINKRSDTLRCVLKDYEGNKNVLVENIIYNNQAYMELNQDAQYEPKGNGTEVGLLKWLQHASYPIADVMYNRIKDEIYRIPFCTTSKYSIVVIKHPNMADNIRVFAKGAPEVVLPCCQFGLTSYGQKGEFSAEGTLSQMKDEMTSKGLRVIAFSYRDLSVQEYENMKRDENFEKLLFEKHTFQAIVALEDPLRERASKFIAFVKKGKITVRMLTGDNFDTAKKVALDCGILDDGEQNDSKSAMEAKQFREKIGFKPDGIDITKDENNNAEVYSFRDPAVQDKFEQIIDSLKVLARSTPEDKRIIAVGLKGMGKKVAVVGDGLNDVESFKIADVSFAMGSSSSVARHNASMVLVNDDFESCIWSVIWGRNIYCNIKRFLQFQVTANFSVLVTVLIGYCYLTESPISAVQLLWINLIIDCLAALALATRLPQVEVIHEDAVTDDHKILTKAVWRQIYCITMWNIIVMSILIFAGKQIFGLEYDRATQTEETVDGVHTPDAVQKKIHLTLIFNTFVFLQIFNEFNCRQVGPSEKNIFSDIFKDWWFMFMVVVMVAVQWSSCNWLHFMFDTANIDNYLFLKCVAWGFTVLIVSFIIKMTPETWIEKMPDQIDETRQIGQDSKLLKFYDENLSGNVAKEPRANRDQSFNTSRIQPATNYLDDEGYQRA